MYRSIHRRIRVLDERGVASFNTVTVPLGSGPETVMLEARTITRDGRVVPVPASAMKRQRGENGSEQTLFAMEGVEPGADIEYLYTERRETSIFGQETFGMPIPVVEARFELIAPERLEFLTKGYAGFPTAKDSVRNGTHYLFAVRYALPALEDEPYSNIGAHAARIGYKVEGVAGEDGEVKRPFSWNALAEAMGTIYYVHSKSERAAMNKYLSGLDIFSGIDEREKIIRIEDALKRSIAISDEIEDREETREIASVLKKKVTTEKGFARLMTAAFLEAGVPVQVGLTANRTDGAFDSSFSNWLTADEYVMYLPGQSAFLAPTAINYRFPFIPYVLTGQQGVFCKPPGITSATGRATAVIRSIPSVPGDSNVHTTTAVVTFAGEDLVPHLQVTNSFKGFNAAGLRDVFVFSPKEKEKEILNALTGLAEKADEIDEYRVEGAAFTGYSTGTPLRLTATLNAPQLMERAGPKYLFKVGDVIGRQVEMYNDERRTLPIEMEYPHSLLREIRVVPPAGYRIQNPDAVKTSVQPMGGGTDAPLGFVSDYRMDGDTLVINIREHYGRSSFDVRDYVPFRQVINAAADWNKVVLAMVKADTKP